MQNEDTKKTLVLALGSNLGNRYYYLYKACQSIALQFRSIVVLSNIYESEPWGNTNQAAFLNTVVTLTTSESLPSCLKKTQAIEQSMGRTKAEHWGPRNIDIDILLLNDEVYASDQLVVPHPQIANRSFVYTPLADLNLAIPPSIQLSNDNRPDGLTLFAPTLNYTIGY